MRAGDLDRRITIQQLTLIPDGGGGSTESWTDLATVSAKVTQQSGREFLQASAVRTERAVLFTIRYRADLTTGNRVVYDGIDHDIREVRELGRQAGLELHTESIG